MPVEFDAFKGNKIIRLKRTDDDKFPFSFGKNKAKLVVEYFDDIKKFAEEDTE